VASSLSTHDFWHLITTQEAVRATYYLVLRYSILALGNGTWALRVASALFMALACAATTLIAFSQAGRRVAIFTGLAFAALPLVAGYGSEARSYAFSAAAVAWSSYFFLRRLEDSRGRWTWYYTASLVITGYAFVYALLIMVVHVLVVISDPGTRSRLRSLLRVQGAAVIIVLPIFFAAWRQKQELSWIPSGFAPMVSNGIGIFVTPFWSGMAATPYPELLALLAWVIIIVGLVRLPLSGRGEVRRLVVLALGWAVVPGMLLSLSSAFGPYFTARYLVFCAPAVALLIGLGASQIQQPRRIAVVCALFVTLALLADTPLFSVAGKDGWGTTIGVLESHGAPGDFVMTTPQVEGQYFNIDPRVTALPHHMTMIDFGAGLPWSGTFVARHWSSSIQAPPTRIIWLATVRGAVGCRELEILRHWGFSWGATYGPSGQPTYEFISSGIQAAGAPTFACQHD